MPLIMNDQCLMPIGKKFKGRKLAEVPAAYLLWIYEKRRWGRRDLRIYIEDRMEELKERVEKSKQSKMEWYKKTEKDLLFKKVKVIKPFKNKAGFTAETGDILFITRKFTGFGLSRDISKSHASDISRVSPKNLEFIGD